MQFQRDTGGGVEGEKLCETALWCCTGALLVLVRVYKVSKSGSTWCSTYGISEPLDAFPIISTPVVLTVFFSADVYFSDLVNYPAFVPIFFFVKNTDRKALNWFQEQNVKMRRPGPSCCYKWVCELTEAFAWQDEKTFLKFCSESSALTVDCKKVVQLKAKRIIMYSWFDNTVVFLFYQAIMELQCLNGFVQMYPNSTD